jgi:3-methyl-2-oxobutanoate hydroxymethyltransferase
MIFEAVPAPVSEQLVPHLTIPVIGIGAGVATDGQVLVTSDLLGLTRGRVPRFVRQYAKLGDEMTNALERFAGEVRARVFPAIEHTYPMDPAEVAKLVARVGDSRNEAPK